MSKSKKLIFTDTFKIMKTFSSINPIPKRFNSAKYFILNILFCLTVFCTEMKAIPEDWPSTDGAEFVVEKNSELLQLSCKGTVQISLDQSGMAVITPSMLLTDNYVSYNQFKVIVNQTTSNKVSCSDIGKIITATVIDTTNGMMCWSYIVVEDKLKPVIVCRGDTVTCANNPFTLDYYQYVIISDNCDTSVSSYFDLNLELFNCTNSRYSSVVHLKWTAIDDYGNTNTCFQDIYFKKSSVDSIVFPQNDTVFCPNPDLEATGVPTLFGDTVSHLCQLIATHADDSVIVCGGMMKINRLWTVIDWCNGSMRSQNQEILVSDTTKPRIICPRDTILYSNYITCKFNYTIPNFIATDDCSPANLLLKAVRLDSSYFLYPGQIVALNNGLHTMEYIAIDPCGNSDTCRAFVEVKDKVTPSMICPPALVVSLSPQGHIYVTADFIAEKGLVRDNCCLDTIQIRRMTAACNRPQDTTFRDIIDFCCDDIGDTLMIVLKATDCSGNMNFCMIQIMVQDKNPRAVTDCPMEITLPCDTNYLDLNVTGQFYALTTCLDSIHATFLDRTELDSCGEGLITRTFFLHYPDGTLERGCQQYINLYNDYIFSPSHVIWPGDTSVSVCLDNHPDSIHSKPWITVETCNSVYFSFQDLPIGLYPDSCEYFDRVWSAYAACSMVTVRDTQRISLLSLAKSKLFAPRDTLVATERGVCSRFINLAPAFLTGCAGNSTITNSHNSGGANASGTYPVGTTVVYFTATDGCATLIDSTIVTVRDLESPIGDCIILNINMEPNDTLRFTARGLLNDYSDNCTARNLLKISFTRNNFNDTVRIITCADLQTIPDTFDFEIFVQDAFGNVGSCITVVNVFDQHGYCTTGIRRGDVGGLIADSKKVPMKGVEVDLIGLNQTLITDDQGSYIFKDIITNQAYTIAPKYDKNWLNGLTTQDIVKIQRHILGIETFDHPYKWIAADLDKNKRISAADIVWLRKLILGKVDAVPANHSWRFVNKAYHFVNPLSPLDENWEEQTRLTGFWQDTIVHFDAIKIGDVSTINNVQELTERLRKTDILIDNKSFNAGDVFKVDLILPKELDIEGMQINFELATGLAELFRIQEYVNVPEGRNLSQDEYNQNSNQLTVSLLVNTATGYVKAQGRVLSLLFRAKQNGTVKDILTPGTQISNEIYPKDDVPVKILFGYKEHLVEDNQLSNWFVDPNPFKERCYIQFHSSRNEEISLSLYDLAGKTIQNKLLNIVKGENTVIVEATDLPAKGTYLYYIRLGDRSYHGKIMRSE